MNDVPRCDYHVHYFDDGCAHDEMTLANIEAEAARLGLDEICVVKHYSETMPNGLDAWVNWKQIRPGAFARYLEDVRRHHPCSGVRMLTGVETELVDDGGRVNIPQAEAEKLDAVILSVHWMPKLSVIEVDPALVPGQFTQSPADAVARWRMGVEAVGAEAIIRNFVEAYVRAIEGNPQVKVLGHMFDGLLPLRGYEVPVDTLGDGELCRLLQPLLAACVEYRVIWELTAEPVERPAVLARAHDMGVSFSATADAHFLHAQGWAHLRNHSRAEDYVASLGLSRGGIRM